MYVHVLCVRMCVCVQGSAVLWFNLLQNGEVDDLTLHSGCPVFRGNKWGTFNTPLIYGEYMGAFNTPLIYEQYPPVSGLHRAKTDGCFVLKFTECPMFQQTLKVQSVIPVPILSLRQPPLVFLRQRCRVVLRAVIRHANTAISCISTLTQRSRGALQTVQH